MFLKIRIKRKNIMKKYFYHFEDFKIRNRWRYLVRKNGTIILAQFIWLSSNDCR